MTDYLDHGYQPGGRLDAQAHAQHHQGATDTGPPPAGPGRRYVLATRIETPSECIPRTANLSTNVPFTRLLPEDQGRWRAIITAIANPVYLTETFELAQQLAAAVAAGQTAVDMRGAWCPVGVGYPLQHKGEMFAVVTTLATVSPVSVITERFAPADLYG